VFRETKTETLVLPGLKWFGFNEGNRFDFKYFGFNEGSIFDFKWFGFNEDSKLNF